MVIWVFVTGWLIGTLLELPDSLNSAEEVCLGESKAYQWWVALAVSAMWPILLVAAFILSVSSKLASKGTHK